MKQAEGNKELHSSCPSLCWAQDFIFYLQIFFFFNFFFSEEKSEKLSAVVQGRGWGREGIVSKHLDIDINLLIHGVLGPSLLCRRYQTDDIAGKEGRFNRDPEIQNARDTICNGCLSKYSLTWKLSETKCKMF